MKILVCGDTHADQKYLDKIISKAKDHQVDRIMQVGDFGWFPKHMNFPSKLDSLGGIELHWIDGNHDDHISISEGILPEMTVYHPRGSYEDDMVFLGGTHSIDWKYRKRGIDWWPEENITPDDLKSALSHESCSIIFTHDCPAFVPISSATEEMSKPSGFDYRSRGNREKLSILWEKYKPKLWFFGHWHKTFHYIKRDGDIETDFVCLPGNAGRYGSSYVVLDTDTMEWEVYGL